MRRVRLAEPSAPSLVLVAAAHPVQVERIPGLETVAGFAKVCCRDAISLSAAAKTGRGAIDLRQQLRAIQRGEAPDRFECGHGVPLEGRVCVC